MRGVFKDFTEHQCRLCFKVFCCRACRQKHEKTLHNIIEFNCDICLYGATRVSWVTEELLTHVKSAHWPLHCVYCSRVFATSEELFQNSKCAVTRYSENSSRIFSENNYPSPPYLCLVTNQKILATSTPMQKNEGTNLELKKLQEVITPVDHSTSNKYSILKKGHHRSENDLANRRVTFSSHVTDPESEKKSLKTEENTENKEDSINLNENISEDIKFAKSESRIDLSVSKYYTAKDFSKYWEAMNSSPESYTGTPKHPRTKTESITEQEEPPEVEDDKPASNTAPVQNEPDPFKTPTSSAKVPDSDIFKDELFANSYSRVESSDFPEESDYEDPSGSKRAESTESEESFVVIFSNGSFKRHRSDHRTDEHPPQKRYKLTEIKCRQSIRGLPRPREDPDHPFRCVSGKAKINCSKTFADKSTQTDEFLYENFHSDASRQNST